MQISWYWRVLRRFGVVFIAGGLIAGIQELGVIQSEAPPEAVLYISAAMGILTAIEKLYRDHTDAKK